MITTTEQLTPSEFFISGHTYQLCKIHGMCDKDARAEAQRQVKKYRNKQNLLNS